VRKTLAEEGKLIAAKRHKKRKKRKKKACHKSV